MSVGRSVCLAIFLSSFVHLFGLSTDVCWQLAINKEFSHLL